MHLYPAMQDAAANAAMACRRRQKNWLLVVMQLVGSLSVAAALKHHLLRHLCPFFSP